MPKKKWLAPMAEDGSLASYVSPYQPTGSWREFFPVIPGDDTARFQDDWAERHYKMVSLVAPEPFYGCLRVLGMHRGRSAAHLIWQSKTGAVLPMFMTDIVTTLQAVDLIDGWTEERDWEIVKRGANYGIKLVAS